MHRDPKAKDKTILWAKNILDRKERYVILDTETTGLGKRDVIIEISIIDLDGNDLYTSLIKPKNRKSIPREASNIHGIKISHLKECPTFTEVIEHVQGIISNKTVLIYNSEYDERLIDQTCEQDECSYLTLRTDCVMEQYSIFAGKWSDYHHDYTFQKLPGGNHTALGDCKATLEVIKKMAVTTLSNPRSENMRNINPHRFINTNKRWWEFWK